MNKVSDDAIQGLLQDMGELCSGAGFNLGNAELFITEANASDWYAAYAELSGLYDKIFSLVERSAEPEPCPPEYIPLYGVTNGRGRVIA